MSKRKVSVEDKICAVNLYLDGKESQRRIADMFDCKSRICPTMDSKL